MLKQTSESEYFGRYKIGSKKKCRLIYNIQQYIDATTDHITPCSCMRARGKNSNLRTGSMVMVVLALVVIGERSEPITNDKPVYIIGERSEPRYRR